MGVDNNNEHYDEQEECAYCGNYFAPEELNDHDMCEDCMYEANRAEQRRLDEEG